MAKTGKRTVAVVDFTDLQGNATELGRFLAEQLSVALGATAGGYEVIDRNHLRAILQEQKLSATGLIDPLTARKVGQMAGAECLISGSIAPFSESVNLSIKLLETNTAKILGAVTLDIARTSTIDELLKSGLSSQLVTSATSVKAPSPATSDAARPTSAITDRAYGVEVNINVCKRDQRSCQGILRNSTEGPLRVVLGTIFDVANGEVIDDLGNQSAAKVALGSGDLAVTLEPDLPVKFWINDFEVAPDATKLTVRFAMEVAASSRRVDGFSGSSSSGGSKTMVLRNLPIR